MNLVETIKNAVQIPWGKFDWAWWVKVDTQEPICTYYFGPYESKGEASTAQSGFVEDLKQEGAEKIAATIKWCKPKDLTVFED